MLGAIIGDIIGSAYEFNNPVSDRDSWPFFPEGARFTDDTVCSVAIADAILNGKSYRDALLEWCPRYPKAGYGSVFATWVASEGEAHSHSFGNGSAMRVSPIGFVFSTLEQTIAEARKSAECTHGHPDGLAGAESVAAAIFLARTGASKEDIKNLISEKWGYDLNRTVEQCIATHKWNCTCAGTVPESIIAFLESSDYESAIRNAIAMRGDADTMAAIAGSIAHAYYRTIPEEILKAALARLDVDIANTVFAFYERYMPRFDTYT